MTNEEAKIVIGNMPIKPEVLDDCYSITEYQEAKTIAIKALEQQSCEDCISRKQALKETKALIRGDYDPEYIIETLKMLPSVTPKALEQQPCEDCISRQEALSNKHIVYDDDGIGYSVVRADVIAKLPSVTPTRPTGKWKKYLDEGGFLQCECSNCGLITNEPDNYCPNCGARMGESEKEI